MVAKHKTLGAVDNRSIALARRAEALRVKNQQTEAPAERAGKHDELSGLVGPAREGARVGSPAPRPSRQNPAPAAPLPLILYLYGALVFSTDSLLVTKPIKTEKEITRERNAPSLPPQEK